MISAVRPSTKYFRVGLGADVGERQDDERLLHGGIGDFVSW